MTLEIKNLCKQYDNSKEPVIENMDLTIEDGEFLCVVGRSGCGKSTLLNLIAGLEEPTEGEILLDGKRISGPGSDRIVMFQQNALFPWLNVIENVMFGLSLGDMPKAEQEEKAMHYLKMMHLQDYSEYYIHQLSGGMQQRVSLARAFCMDSDILLMDEPFSALDRQTSKRLQTELQNIWMETGRTIFFITHSAEEAVFLGDKVAVMETERGGFREFIPIELEHPRDKYDEKFIEYRYKIERLII